MNNWQLGVSSDFVLSCYKPQVNDKCTSSAFWGVCLSVPLLVPSLFHVCWADTGPALPHTWGCRSTLPFPSAPAEKKKEAFLDLGRAGGWPHLDEKKKKLKLFHSFARNLAWNCKVSFKHRTLLWVGLEFPDLLMNWTQAERSSQALRI